MEVMIVDHRAHQLRHLIAQDVVEPVEDLVGQMAGRARDVHSLEGIGRTVGAHHQVARAGPVEFAVTQGEDHPLGVEVLLDGPYHRQDQGLGPLRGLHEGPRDAVEGFHDPGESLFDTPELRVVRSLDRMQAEQRFEALSATGPVGVVFCGVVARGVPGADRHVGVAMSECLAVHPRDIRARRPARIGGHARIDHRMVGEHREVFGRHPVRPQRGR